MVMQSHNCAFLKDDYCVGDEHCQYKLTTACYPLGPYFCGKDMILRSEALPDTAPSGLYYENEREKMHP